MHWEKIEIKVKRQEPIPGKSPGRKGGKHGPGRKWGHTLNAVNYGRQVYVFGGYGKDERQTNDVYVYNTTKDAWSKPNIKGTPPSPRDSHTSTVVGSRLFVFGGTDGSSGLNDLYMLDTSTNTWTRLAAQGDVPAAREGHAAARVEGLVYVFGGCGKAGEGGMVDETYYNDVHVFNPDTMRWARVATTGTAPSPRDSHSCCAWGNQLIVFGGEDSRNCYLSDVFVLDTRDRNPFPMQAVHVAVTAGRYMVVFGGFTVSLAQSLSPLLSLPFLGSLVWREVRARGQKPLPRAGHVAVTAGRYMVVFGGFTDERRLFNDLHVLDLCMLAFYLHWQQYTFTGVSSLQSSTIAHSVSSSLPSLPPCAPFYPPPASEHWQQYTFTGVSSLQSSTIAHSVSSSLPSLPRCAPFYPPPASEHWQQYTPTGDVPSRRFSLSADLLDTVSGKMMLFGGCNDDLEALEDAYFLHTDFGSHAVEFPRPHVRRRPFDSMPMPMDARMGMDPRMAVEGGGTPISVRTRVRLGGVTGRAYLLPLILLSSHSNFGSHAVEFPRPRVRRRSFDSMPMPMDARMGMDGRMAMDAGVGMGAGGTPMGMRGKRGESGEGVWGRGAEGVYEAGGMDDDDGYRPPARRMRVPQVSPALPPGLHPADLIAPAGREVPFEAQIVDVFHLGYCLRATVAGRPLHGLLFSYDPSFAQAALARQAQLTALPLLKLLCLGKPSE
ncbi:unnamed protein product [Closterium sp. NIES-64]|nr:unnamed protein product [Closterium sp. NIES-64]